MNLRKQADKMFFDRQKKILVPVIYLIFFYFAVFFYPPAEAKSSSTRNISSAAKSSDAKFNTGLKYFNRGKYQQCLAPLQAALENNHQEIPAVQIPWGNRMMKRLHRQVLPYL